ncbi:BTAD domain-containing putative transcriptional regulator [Egicoccus sp. AB-alg2]|uniref:BTAD domain-containing putative transcriptional regulator n=1 Tax=Egicoccus sp. AB-alg2 TaxID=3242693 RepID=UPI00359D439B
MVEPVRIRVLGPLAIERAGVAVPLTGPRRQRLLTALVLAGGSTVSTDALVTAVWGDDPPDSARNSLQSHVTRLRELLGGVTTIRGGAAGYALTLAPGQVDAERFTAAVAAARRRTGEPATTVPVLEAALAWWHGRAYGELADDLAQVEAARLERLRLEARVLLAGARLRVGDAPTAVAELQAVAAEQHLDEEAALTLATALAAAGRVPDALAALGRWRRTLADELGLDPGPRVADLERRLLRGGTVAWHEDPTPAVSTTAAVTSPRSTVSPTGAAAPPEHTASYGRDRERERVTAALRSGPLVTVVGPGGVGKTHLAGLVAATEPAVWVDLATARTGDEVAGVVLEAMDAGPSGGADPLTQAVEVLARHRGLVVLDNCEHVLDTVATVVGTVLRRRTDVRLLATSRQRLDVDGEVVRRLEPLPVPATDDASEADAGVALFLDRVARAGGPPVAVRDAAAVVGAVDGLPLAIELAAARAAALPVGTLLARLRTHLDVLDRPGGRGALRHRTVRGVVDWSYDLLPEVDQRLFRHLGVFSATFGLQDVRAVCGEPGTDGYATAAALGRLVECSLVVRVGDERYRLLEPVRLDAWDRLRRDPQAPMVFARQTAAVLDLVRRSDQAVNTAAETEALRDLVLALPDLRAVHRRALAAGDGATLAEMTGMVHRAAYVLARADLLDWGRDVLDRDDVTSPSLRTRVQACAIAAAMIAGRTEEAQRLAAPLRDGPFAGPEATTLTEMLGDLCITTGDLDGGLALYATNLELARAQQHPGLMALALVGTSLAHGYQERSGEAVRAAEEAVALAERSGAPSTRAMAHYALGEALADVAPDRALEALDTALQVAAAGGARFAEGVARLADVAVRGRHGEPGDALRRHRDALTMWLEAGADAFLATGLRNLVVLFARIAADADAVELAAALERLVTRPSFGSEARRIGSALEAARARLGSAEVAAARRAGDTHPDIAALTVSCLARIDALAARR